MNIDTINTTNEFTHASNLIVKQSIKVKRLKVLKTLNRPTDNDFEIPTFPQYTKFVRINYPVSFLKIICKNYKLKLSGNKPEIKDRIYNFLLNSNYIIKLQKYIRGYFVRLDHKLRGKAFYNRALSMNSTDFFTLENIIDIPQNAFYSYECKGNVWGFNLISIYNLFIKSEYEVLNPYTREKINYKLFVNIKRLIRLTNILNAPVNIVLNKDEMIIRPQKKIEIKCLELFQYMDQLGNYTDCKWFMNLNRSQLIKFVRELIDIWNYRAQLSPIVKKEICSPHGDPFRYIDSINLPILGYSSLQKSILFVIEQFIKKGIDRESCNLGASYILCGLTLVNHDAALAMPWLYQSVSGIE